MKTYRLTITFTRGGKFFEDVVAENIFEAIDIGKVIMHARLPEVRVNDIFFLDIFQMP